MSNESHCSSEYISQASTRVSGDVLMKSDSRRIEMSEHVWSTDGLGCLSKPQNVAKE